MNLEEARELVATMAAEYPAAYQLAKVVSLAVRIELELLRKARIDLLPPEVDAGAEADLLFSSLVQTQSPLAMTFEPAVTEVLREHLATDQTLLQATWKLLDKFHQDAPPALRLEEEVTWLALSGENSELIRERLESVVVAMARDNRPGLAKWAIRALPAMPKMARDSDMARILSLVASAPEAAVSLSLPSSGGSGGVNEWLSQIISHNLPQVSVGVRLLTQQSADTSAVSAPDNFHFARPAGQNSVVVEFSYPPATGLGLENTIEAPQTNPVLLEVSWPAEPEPRVERISLQPQETRQIEVGSEDLTIRTALGDVHTLRPRFDYDFYLHYNASDYDWARHLPRMFEQDPDVKFYFPVNDEQVYGRDPREHEPQLRLSRKVGFLLNPRTIADDWKDLMALAHKRPDFQRMSYWLIPIINESFELDIPSFFMALNPIDFGRVGAKNAYQHLLSRVTGKPIAVGEDEIKVEPQETPAGATTAPADPESKPLEVYVSYSQKDRKLVDEFFKHVKGLEKLGLINIWDDSEEIPPGIQWRKELEKRLNSADIIILLVSSNYLGSSWLMNLETKRALDRHQKGEARVIPILVGPITEKQSTFSNIQLIPRNFRPISSWKNREEAYAEVMQDLRVAIDAALAERSRVEPQPDQAVTWPSSIPPPPDTGFVARNDEKGKDIVESLKEALKPGASARTAVVGLVGPGGVGKTTVAAETARRLSEVFRQRIVWVNAGVPRNFNLDTLLNEIATQLRYPTLRSLPPNRKEEEVMRLTRESPTLIIADNFEVIDSDARSACSKFLTSKAHCCVLIVSRERLRLPRNFSIDAMSAEEASRYLDLLLRQFPYVARLQGFDRTEVFNAVEGNVLLMQWIVKQMAVSESARVLSDVRRHTGDAAERVYDNFFGNYYISDDAEKTLLALSLFSPDASRVALNSMSAENVVAENEALTQPDIGRQVSDLAHADSVRMDNSLQDLSNLGLIHESGSSRRVSLEGLALGLTKARFIKNQRAKEFQRRFVSYFAASAKEAGPAATTAFELERHNLITAMELAHSISDWPSVIRLFETDFSEFLISGGYLNEAWSWCSYAVTAARDSNNRPVEARGLMQYVAIYAQRGELFQRHAESAIRIFQELKDYKSLALAYEQIATIEMQKDNWVQVANCVRGSVDAYRALGDREAFAAVVEKFGAALEATNRFDEAAIFYEEIDRSSQIAGDRQGRAFTSYHLGRVAHLAGHRKQAIELLRRSVDYSERAAKGDEDPYASKARDLLAKIEQEQPSSQATKASSVSKARRAVPTVKSATAKSARSKAPTKKALTTKIARPKTRTTKSAVPSTQKSSGARSKPTSRSSGGRMGGSKTSRKGVRSKPAKTFTPKKR